MSREPTKRDFVENPHLQAMQCIFEEEYSADGECTLGLALFCPNTTNTPPQSALNTTGSTATILLRKAKSIPTGEEYD